MARTLYSSIEALESRIAPAALTLFNPMADVVAGIGKTSLSLDLGHMFDATATSPERTHVEFTTNFDMDTNTPGLQAGKIVLELFDDKTPLTVQNFLGYVNNVSSKGDYDGVIFSRLVQGFVLQTGGYDVAHPSQHIAVGPEVHNEFNGTDSELRPTTGTIALAKTGQSANSGTSEFFFNLGDNSSNLDNQNGGFTVFGKVISGMDVVNAIAAQPTAITAYTPSIDSAPSGMPYQGNYDPNPDHNLATPSPLPKPDQAIQIVSAKVLPPVNSVSTDISYSVDVTDHTSGASSAVVHSTLSGDTLTLKYAKGLSGVADVKITATPLDPVTHQPTGDPSVTDTFTVSVLPNLIVHSGGDTLQNIIGPSDTATAKAVLTNTGAASLIGKYDINFTLTDTTTHSSVQIGSIAGKNLNIGSGQSLTLNSSLHLPTSFRADDGHVYQLGIQATPSEAGSVRELYTDDNSSFDGSQHNWANAVGKVVVNGKTLRNVPTVSYTDSNNHLVSVTVTGGGYGILSQAGSSSMSDFGLVDSTAKTKVSFAVAGGGHTSLNNVIVYEDLATDGSPVGTLAMGNVDLTGSFVASGSAKSITLGDFLPTDTRHQFLIGGSTALAKVAPAIHLGTVHDTSLSSGVVVGSLSATAWLDSGDQDIISAPGLLKLTIAGDLQSDVTVNANVGDPTFVNTDSSTTNTVKSFKVGGAIQDASVKIAANVGTVDVGAILASKFLVGSDSVPSSAASFEQIRTIASFIVRGAAGQEFALSDSDIAAAKFNSIQVKGAVEGLSGTDDFGFVADTIGSYVRTGGPALKNLTTGDYDEALGANYRVHLV